MQIQEQFAKPLTQQIAALQQEVNDLKIAKAALDAQNKMLENLLQMAETPELEQMLSVCLQQAIDLATQLTQAECGAITLLNAQGMISDTVFQCKDVTPAQQFLAQCIYDLRYVQCVVRSSEALVISDTQHSDFFTAQPSLSIRSVLAVPILKNERILGIVTLVHSQPHYFDRLAADLMEAITKQMALAIEYSRFYEKLELYAQTLKTELEKGRQIQQDFLPMPLLQMPGWEIVAFFQPARRVAGDFYDTFPLPGGSIAIVVGDVCDKGVGAALFMGLFRSLLRLFSGLHPLPGVVQNDLDALEAVRLTNQYIAENHSQLFMFATIFFGVLDPETGTLNYINAGHEAPIVVRQSGTRERLKPTGQVVGPMLDAKFDVKQVQLEPGDILLAYSDGVPDARSTAKEFFTEKKLLSLVDPPASSATMLLEQVQSALQSHIAEADPFDDITILAVQRDQTL